MICPKCGFENPPERKDCLRCRVIFAKIRYRDDYGEEPVPVDTVPQPFHKSTAETSTLSELLFSVSDPGNTLALRGRAAILMVLAVWGLLLILAGIDSNGPGGGWLHLINTPFHEAGHIIFRPFGSFVHSLGGTLGQLLVPMICLLVLLFKTRDPVGAAVFLWWFGQNFLDIAPYINDARALQLPLLGGNVGHSSPYGFHDWEYLLTESGLLRYDHALASASHTLGSLVMLLAVVWGGAVLRRQFHRRSPGDSN